MLPLLLFAWFADTPERCSVSGTVVDSITGSGIARVEMALEPFDRLAHHTAVSTSDGDGRFSLVDVECGGYRLTGRRARYLEARRVVLKLDAGTKLEKVKYKLIPAGAIAGTVWDVDGEPVPEAHLILIRKIAGETRGVESIDADDQGHYRFGSLRPGTYHVAAEPRDRLGNKVDHSERRGSPPESPVVTYYPGAANASAASPVVVAAGAEVTGVHITMLRSRVYRVRGRVVGAPEGQPMELKLRDEDDLPDFHPTTFTRPGGEFEFGSVPPGSYFVSTGYTRTPVVVAAADVEDLRVVVSGGASLEGTVRVEGERRAVSGMVQLMSSLGVERVSQILDDSRFAFRDVPAGQYRFEVHPRSATGLYVKSIRAGDTDVLRDGLTVGGYEVVKPEIVLAPAAQINGDVVNGDEEPVAGATVLFLPGRKFAVTDQDGRFVIFLGPGEYRAYAWDDDGEESEFLEEYAPQRVIIDDIARKSVRLKLSSK